MRSRRLSQTYLLSKYSSSFQGADKKEELVVTYEQYRAVFSCRKTKTKVIALIHNRRRQSNQPIKT